MPVGVTMQPAMDTPPRSRGGQASCSFCGQAWFGNVAYCPYCGRPSAGAPAGPRADAVARAHDAGSAHEPAPAPEPPVPAAAKQKPGGAASAPAADEQATEALADYVRSFNGKMRLFDAPAEAPTEQPRSRRKAAWKPIVTAATALVLVAIAIAVKELAAPTGASDGAAPQSATRAPAAGVAGHGTAGPGDRVAVPRAAPAPAPATAAVTAPMTAPATVPVATPVLPSRSASGDTAPAPGAPPAPHRSLCSAANEAAGLCKPQ